MTGATCELCEAARLTTWYHEDEVCWIADCEICDVPMVVWREHRADPPPQARSHMVTALGRVADGVFGAGGWSLDDVMRQIPDHFHAHARDPHWWQRRFGLGRERRPDREIAATGAGGGDGGRSSATE